MRRSRRILLVTVVAAMVAFGLATAPGVALQTTVAPSAKLSAPGVDGNAALLKVDSVLRKARLLADDGLAETDISERLAGVVFKDGRVQLDITVRLDPGVLDALEAAGLRSVDAYPQYGRVSGWAALADLPAIAAIPQVRVVHQEYGYTTNVGSTTSQADVSINADDARSTYGIDGTGVTVGVLSDSLNTTLGGATAGAGCSRTVTGMVNQGTGDLPSPMTLLDNGPGTTDEGAAMAELIADLAPGADIAFHSAGSSQTAFASGITDLKDCGADVIVDDVIFFAEPMFQDGVVAQAAQDAVDSGVPYFSSAGNQGTFGIDDTFSGSGTAGPLFGGDLHDFGGGDLFASVVVPAGAGVRFVVQWNDPYDGAGGADGNPGNAGPGALADYDVAILDTASAAGTVLGFSSDTQGCGGGGPGVQGGDPLEIATYVNPGPGSNTVFLAIERFCSQAGSGDHLRVGTFGVGISITGLTFEADYSDKQIYGHSAAKGAVAVAAIDFCEVDLGGGLSGAGGVLDVEAFSSLGGDIPIYFNPDGTAIAGGPELRKKPEITAPDGTNTTFFGGGHAAFCGENDAFPNFFGTSAAAPHAAAAAALMLELGPATPPDAVLAILQATAVDAETAGFDFLSGAGVIDIGVLPGLCAGALVTIDGTGASETLVGTAKADVIRGKGGDDTLSGKGGNDILCGGPGDDTLIGGRDDDFMYGDGGTDTVDYSGTPGPVSVNLQLKRATGHGTDRIENVENIIGSAFDDTLRGNAKRNIISGGNGADGINALGGDDDLFGDAGADNLNGRRGDDLINGGGGTDQATFIHAPGPATVDLSVTVSQVTGDGFDRLLSVENLFGSRFGDTLTGNSGPNVIKGSKGNDDLFGLNGNDTLLGNQGTDTADGGGGGSDRCVAETEVNCEL